MMVLNVFLVVLSGVFCSSWCILVYFLVYFEVVFVVFMLYFEMLLVYFWCIFCVF